jgi:dihydrofolate synthase/folylpolyglutamate synthase
MIPEAEVVDFIEKHKPYFEEHKLSFFEMTVGMAFSFFEKEKVDFAVIEVGLGGRLDASNIIKPILSIITNIGLDHTQFLGTTRPEIATEKAGIIKEGIPVVIGEQHPETEAVFRNKALKMKAPIFFVKNNTVQLYESDLKGSYQKANLQTTVLAIQQLNAGEISEEVLKNGLSKVVKNTHLMGRWQTLSEQPKIIADVGHNKEGLEYIAAQLKNTTYDRLHLVMGFVKGRAIDELIALFPAEANFYISTPNLERGYAVKDLKEVINERENTTTFFDTIPIAFESAKVVATPKDLIFVCGSTFVVAEILAHLKENKINL